jgi:hypothetical protein
MAPICAVRTCARKTKPVAASVMASRITAAATVRVRTVHRDHDNQITRDLTGPNTGGTRRAR